ncbi:hypothetical protein DPMN_061447 [Dreissena polymorpha]|uniref:PIPK domain-containing protein n=1 Tax=Dreissena polymorpha TaxID=45954 RepID=A0A9D4HJ65_DREPO|nr:hypothetical protein DPMN_061447 [Dreissena polymorpha]
MLPHYLGMYRITVNDVETYLCVMRNVFSPRQPTHKKYDLKVCGVSRCFSRAPIHQLILKTSQFLYRIFLKLL